MIYRANEIIDLTCERGSLFKKTDFRKDEKPSFRKFPLPLASGSQGELLIRLVSKAPAVRRPQRRRHGGAVVRQASDGRERRPFGSVAFAAFDRSRSSFAVGGNTPAQRRERNAAA
jgi:hypothetical protein